MTSFQIKSREGLTIGGNIDARPHARALVVIVHGYKGFKDWGFYPWLAEYLCDEGLAVVRFNMSRNGIGEDPESFDRLDLFAEDTYSIQIHDLLDVVKFSQSRFRGLPLFLLGHSRGGGVSLLASPEVEDLAGVITWSSIAHVGRWDDATKKKWRADGYIDGFNVRTKQVMRSSTALLDDYENNHSRLDILACAARLRVPLLAVHGGDDESVPLSESQELVRAAGDASLLVIDGASHTYNAIHPLVHVPRALQFAAAVSEHFVCAYS